MNTLYITILPSVCRTMWNTHTSRSSFSSCRNFQWSFSHATKKDDCWGIYTCSKSERGYSSNDVSALTSGPDREDCIDIDGNRRVSRALSNYNYNWLLVYQKSQFVYYESIKREPNIRGIYECRCDERLQTKTKEFTHLGYTPSRLRLIRKAVALGRMFPHFDVSIEEKAARRKWKNPRSNVADWTPEAAKKNGRFPDEPVRIEVW